MNKRTNQGSKHRKSTRGLTLSAVGAVAGVAGLFMVYPAIAQQGSNAAAPPAEAGASKPELAPLRSEVQREAALRIYQLQKADEDAVTRTQDALVGMWYAPNGGVVDGNSYPTLVSLVWSGSAIVEVMDGTKTLDGNWKFDREGLKVSVSGGSAPAAAPAPSTAPAPAGGSSGTGAAPPSAGGGSASPTPAPAAGGEVRYEIELGPNQLTMYAPSLDRPVRLFRVSPGQLASYYVAARAQRAARERALVGAWVGKSPVASADALVEMFGDGTAKFRTLDGSMSGEGTWQTYMNELQVTPAKSSAQLKGTFTASADGRTLNFGTGALNRVDPDILASMKNAALLKTIEEVNKLVGEKSKAYEEAKKAAAPTGMTLAKWREQANKLFGTWYGNAAIGGKDAADLEVTLNSNARAIIRPRSGGAAMTGYWGFNDRQLKVLTDKGQPIAVDLAVAEDGKVTLAGAEFSRNAAN